MISAILLLPFLSALVACVLTVLVVVHNCRARANQLLAAGLFALGAHQSALGAALFSPTDAWLFTFARAALGLAALLPPCWLAFCMTFGENNGNSHRVPWRPSLLVLCAAAPAVWTALAAGHLVRPVRLGSGAAVHVGVDLWGKGFLCVFLVGLTLVLLHAENLYRHADRITRWRIKFLVVGLFVALSTQVVTTSYALLYGVFHPSHSILSSLAFLVGEALIAFSLVRHRILQVDIFVSRYVVYRSLTLALIGGYLICLGIVAEIFQWLNIRLDLMTGIVLGSLGAACLALILLSDDVRRRIQSFLHTHFYKHKYDYRVEWMEFTRRLSQVTAIPEIAAHTVQRVLEVMWIRRAAMYSATITPGRLTLAHQVGYESLPAELELSASTVQQLRDNARSRPGALPQSAPFPIPLETAEALRDCTEGVVVPVVALDCVAGLLVVGPEQSGKPFGVDDRDLLAAVAAQAGAMIVNARLAQEAAEGREVQALARLSAFVAHDLKNSVSMLSMLAENAPLHMHKPEFQADAVHTLTEVTARMQKLLTTLSTSNNRPAGSTTRASLAAAVETWMTDLKSQVPSRITLETRLEPTPDVVMDPEQVRAVVMNLVLNAIEATPDEGRITVETGTDGGLAILSVADTGRGMTSDFVRDRLFRPFQTTKPRGLGIGLYQCRHIVEALGGELTAESQEGVGTRMTVRLPAAERTAEDAERNPVPAP